MSIKSVITYSHLILCYPLLLLPSIIPSIKGFSTESGLCIRWPKYWSFSFSISPSNDYLGLISLGLTGLIFLQSKGTLKSLLQRHSSKVSTLRCSAFFIVYLSHPYMTTGKTSKDFRLCRPYTLHCTHSIQLLQSKSSHRQYIRIHEDRSSNLLDMCEG